MRNTVAIPSELVATILSFVGPSHAQAVTGEEERAARRALANCSLVCSHWALSCRRKLFKVLTLRSAEDVLTLRLLTLLHWPGSRLAPLLWHVRFMAVECTLTSGPSWVYNLFSFLQSQQVIIEHPPDDSTEISRVRGGIPISLTLRIVGPLPESSHSQGDTQRYSNIFSKGLPRAIPARCCSCNSLVIENLQFKDYSEFRNLLQCINRATLEGQLNSSRLTLRNVTVEHPTGAFVDTSLMAFFAPFPREVLFEAVNCGADVSTLLWIGLTQLASQRRPLSGLQGSQLFPGDNQALLEIAGSILTSCISNLNVDESLTLRLIRTDPTIGPEPPVLGLTMNMVHMLSSSHGEGSILHSYRPTFDFDARPIVGAPDDEYYISAVSIFISTDNSIEEACLALDWTVIVEALRYLPGLCNIALEFYTHNHVVQFFQDQKRRDAFRHVAFKLCISYYGQTRHDWRSVDSVEALLDPEGLYHVL